MFLKHNIKLPKGTPKYHQKLKKKTFKQVAILPWKQAAQGYILYECLWINVVFHDIRKYTITAIFCPIYLQKQSHARGGFYFDVLIHTVRFSLSLWNLYRTLFLRQGSTKFRKVTRRKPRKLEKVPYLVAVMNSQNKCPLSLRGFL